MGNIKTLGNFGFRTWRSTPTKTIGYGTVLYPSSTCKQNQIYFDCQYLFSKNHTVRALFGTLLHGTKLVVLVMTCHDVMTPGVFYWTTPKLQTKKSPKPPRPTKRLKTNRPITKTQDSRSATPQQPRVGNSVWPIFVLHILAKWIFPSVCKIWQKTIEAHLVETKNAESGISTNLNLSYPPIPYI